MKQELATACCDNLRQPCCRSVLARTLYGYVHADTTFVVVGGCVSPRKQILHPGDDFIEHVDSAASRWTHCIIGNVDLRQKGFCA